MPEYADGHRQRMRRRAEQLDVEDMRDQDLLELLLYYALPRRDTKPHAAELMNEFGTLEAVLNAPKSELVKIKGIGGRTAEWLASVGEAAAAYAELRSDDRPRMNTLLRAKTYICKFFARRSEEDAWQFCLNSGGYLLGSAFIAENGAWGEPFYLREALSQALESRAHSVIIGCRESRTTDLDDYETEHALNYAATLAVAGIQLLDYIRICPDRVISMYDTGLLDKVRALVSANALRESYSSVP